MGDFEYNVQKSDKGLSYIFLEQAKKSGYDTSKNIDWNKVMSVFDKIQTDKQKSGDKLYSGGNDKTSAGYKTSYIINEGDKIQLSEGEMNEIYQAMGFDVSNKKWKDYTKEILLPPEEEGQFLGAPNSSMTLRNGNTLKFSSFGRKDEVRDADNKLIRKYNYIDPTKPQFSQETNYSSINYEYDSNGRKSKEIYIGVNGNVIKYSDFEYDKDGNVTEIKRNPDGSLISKQKAPKLFRSFFNINIEINQHIMELIFSLVEE